MKIHSSCTPSPSFSVYLRSLSFLLLNPLFHTIPFPSLCPSLADAMTFLAAA